MYEELPLKLPVDRLPMRLNFKPPLTDGELQTFCERQDVLHVEREPDGSLSVRSIWGTVAGGVSGEVKCQLFDWADKTGKGLALGTVGFFLPDGSMRGPLICFVSKDKWDSLETKDCFLPFCPESVIEVFSFNYSRAELEERMHMWIANGCELAWLIDPESRTVTVYRPDREPEVRAGNKPLSGIGAVEDFVLEFTKLWI